MAFHHITSQQECLCRAKPQEIAQRNFVTSNIWASIGSPKCFLEKNQKPTRPPQTNAAHSNLGTPQTPTFSAL
jgi:hypothetical protein